MIFRITQDAIAGPWFRGRLALAGIDLSAPLDLWLDAVYALLPEMPGEQLGKIAGQIERKAAQLDPEAARENWGRSAVHRQLAGKLGQGPGVESGSTRGLPPEIQRGPKLTPGRRNLRNPRG